MQEHDDAAAAGQGSKGARKRPAPAWVAHYEPVVRAYLTELLGGDAASPACDRAMAELTMVATDPRGTPTGADTVRRVARGVALDTLDVEAKRPSRPRSRLGADRKQCAAVATRLRGRVDGQISVAELDNFYRHVEECEVCAEIAGRFTTSEWQLQADLASLEAHTPVASPSAIATPDASTSAAIEVSSSSKPTTVSTQSVRQPVSRRRRILRGLVVGVVLLAAGSLYLSQRAPKRAGVPAAARPAPLTAVTGPTAATDVAGPSHAPKVPFTFEGARFAVFPNPKQAWTTFAARVSAGPGNRWVLVSVRTRNLTLAAFDPRLAQYRLIGADGVNYLPNATYGTDLHGPARKLAPGALAQVELAFQVPAAAQGLQLAFDPTGRHKLTYVALGI